MIRLFLIHYPWFERNEGIFSIFSNLIINNARDLKQIFTAKALHSFWHFKSWCFIINIDSIILLQCSFRFQSWSNWDVHSFFVFILFLTWKSVCVGCVCFFSLFETNSPFADSKLCIVQRPMKVQWQKKIMNAHQWMRMNLAAFLNILFYV